MFLKVLLPTGPMYVNIDNIKHVCLEANGDMTLAYNDSEYKTLPRVIWSTAVIITADEALAEMKAT